MLPEGGDSAQPGDGPRDPGQYPEGPNGAAGNYSGPNPAGPNGGGTPVVRKLALDLRGVAGFAIVDQDGDSGSMTATLDFPLDGEAFSSGTRQSGTSSAEASSTLWLSSATSGQVLQARTLDPSALRAAILGRSGMGAAQPNSATRGWAAQEGDGAPPPPPPGTDGALPAPPTDSSGGGSGSTDGGDASGETAGEQAGLLKITQDGEVVPALVALEEEPLETPPTGADAGAPDPVDTSGDGAEPPPPPPGGAGGAPTTGEPPRPPGVPTGPNMGYEPLPRVTAVGLAPDGNVYILFERSFMHRAPTAEEMSAGVDPYSAGSPFRCQLFRASGNWQEVAADQAALAELECVTNEYEVRTWDARRVMQFDAAGNLYFRASLPMQQQEVFYKYDPETRELHEKVNGNICWRDVQVTPRGSLFYTGISGTNGDCTGTSFFRYVSADNRLTEIARDWWNFKYLAEQDPADPDNERIIFYGPDPNATGGFSWDSACLYRYNPAIEDPAARTQKLVECSSDPHRYVYGPNGGGTVSDDDLAGFGERCESEGQIFVGGEGVTGLSQLQDGTLFAVGTFQKKLAGEVHCGLDTQSDHCNSLDAAHATEQACADAGHVWQHVQPYCSNPEYDNQPDCSINSGVWTNGVGFMHYNAVGTSCLTPPAGFTRTQTECRSPGQAQPGPMNLVQQVTGLAYLVPGEAGGLSELRLLSDPTEEVERYWALDGAAGPELYYSVYSGGQYNLRMARESSDGEGNVEVERRLILEDHEVYNLQRDPADASRVLFDALQFSTNQYLFGSADTTLPTPEEIQASVEAVQGVSGRVETLIVLPDF